MLGEGCDRACGFLAYFCWTHHKAVNQCVMYVGGVTVLALFCSVITTSGVNLLGR